MILVGNQSCYSGIICWGQWSSHPTAKMEVGSSTSCCAQIAKPYQHGDLKWSGFRLIWTDSQRKTNLSGNGHLVECVPQQNADDGVVSAVENHTLAKLITVLRQVRGATGVFVLTSFRRFIWNVHLHTAQNNATCIPSQKPILCRQIESSTAGHRVISNKGYAVKWGWKCCCTMFTPFWTFGVSSHANTQYMLLTPLSTTKKWRPIDQMTHSKLCYFICYITLTHVLPSWELCPFPCNIHL